MLELWDRGLTIEQIALQVGMCGRTVQRDLAKVKAQVKRQLAHFACAKDGQMDDLSLDEQLECIQDRFGHGRKMPRKIPLCKSFVVTIDDKLRVCTSQILF